MQIENKMGKERQNKDRISYRRSWSNVGHAVSFHDGHDMRRKGICRRKMSGNANHTENENRRVSHMQGSLRQSTNNPPTTTTTTTKSTDENSEHITLEINNRQSKDQD